MSLAGHVSRYSHVRMEANRKALEEIGARRCAADENLKVKAERRAQGAAVGRHAPLSRTDHAHCSSHLEAPADWCGWSLAVLLSAAQFIPGQVRAEQLARMAQRGG